MTRLSRRFLLVLGFLLLATAGITVHAKFSAKSSTHKDVQRISTLPGFSLSVAWYEPRIRDYADTRHRVYLDVMPCSRMEFVYAP